MGTVKVFCDEKDCNNFMIVENYRCTDHRIFKEIYKDEVIVEEYKITEHTAQEYNEKECVFMTPEERPK